MADTLSIVKGTDRDFDRQVRDAAGEPFAPGTNPSPFLPGDALSAKVWAGGDLPTLCAPACAWIDPARGTFTVTVAAADTAALQPGTYRYQAYVTRGGRTGKVDDARFRVTRTAGAGTEGLAFTTLPDLLLYAPWLEDLQADGGEAGFRAEQVRATRHLIDVLVQVWQNGGGLLTVGQPGFPSVAAGGGVPPSYWLRQVLTPLAPNATPDATLYPDRQPGRGGFTTPPNFVDPAVSTALLLYPEVKEVCARWAIAYACRGQVGRDGGDDYARLGGFFADEANGLYFRQAFQVDVADPQTGTAGIVIRGGHATMRGY